MLLPRPDHVAPELGQGVAAGHGAAAGVGGLGRGSDRSLRVAEQHPLARGEGRGHDPLDRQAHGRARRVHVARARRGQAGGLAPAG